MLQYNIMPHSLTLVMKSYKGQYMEIINVLMKNLVLYMRTQMQKCQQAYRTYTDVPSSPANEASGGPTLSLFSRFSFS